jgi:endonuclease/exonuclease/phosphatase (EEP) superfamily protein YafD
MVNGENVLVFALYLSNNTLIDDCKRFVLTHLGTFAPKFSEEYSIVPEEGPNTIPIILAGDFNIDLKKKENETFVTYVEKTFGLKLMSNPQCSTTRSKSCIDMVFARNVDNLKCANYITYFSYHRPILNNKFNLNSVLNSFS